MLADRICIHTGGEVKVTLSPQDMVSCSFENYSCDGGYLAPSLEFLTTEGVASDTCVPYTDKAGTCKYKCSNKQEQFKKYYCAPGTMTILTNVEAI